jgi:hypothetical protein
MGAAVGGGGSPNGGVEGEASALERAAAREWAPFGGGSGHRTSACTDISPTCLHGGNRYENWCRVEIPLAVWKTGPA